MGKGDIKTRRGKIFNNSYGARRPKKQTRPVIKGKAIRKATGKKS